MVKQRSILHITSWYPSEEHPHRALFIKEHIDALNRYCMNHVLHLEVVESKQHILRFKKTRISEYEESLICYTRIKIWMLLETIAFFMVMYELVIKRKARNADLVNLYIAYPVGLFIKTIRAITRKPVTITEQWTAYFFNFYLDTDKRGLNRIRNIFKKDAHLITVSDALAQNIRDFSRNDSLIHSVIPNVVDHEVFNFKANAQPPVPTFFMVNAWGVIKNPIIVIEAFTLLLEKHPEAMLRIGGYGMKWEQIIQAVKEKGIEKNVVLLGPLTKQQIAAELSACTALTHASFYETFSVICAESVCCGTPVIASKVGGIPSFINESNGILLENETPGKWMDAMLTVINDKGRFNRSEIASQAKDRFSVENVGRSYYEIFSNVLTSSEHDAAR